ncbi:hypothetical protein HQO83_24410 [Rhodococcus fascians]|nr:hypothetical protein [Rhodococcus fascians]
MVRPLISPFAVPQCVYSASNFSVGEQMYYEHVLNEHRQRVARGVENYERHRVAQERAAENATASEKGGRSAKERADIESTCDTSDSGIELTLISSDR